MTSGLFAWPVILAGLAAAQPDPVCNRVRYFPAPNAGHAMVGGRISGSNVSQTKGFETLATIQALPLDGQWAQVRFENSKVYRWLRYEGPPGSAGRVAELEFYDGDRKLNPLAGYNPGFGTIACMDDRRAGLALDGKTETWYETHVPDGQYVGIDIRDSATARTPGFDPPPGDFSAPVKVTMRSATPGALIRYTLDGTMPTRDTGILYTAPVTVEKNTTFNAIAFMEGRAPSPAAAVTYLMDSSSRPGFHTFHPGNSLTSTSSQLARYARAAGFRHEYRNFIIGGASVTSLWNVGRFKEKERWETAWNGLSRIDHLTLQPRDFNVTEEAENCIRFFRLTREKSPGMQPWLYTEWTEMIRQRPTDKGLIPSRQMRKLWPAGTWEESMSAMLLYVEEVQRLIAERYSEGKRPRVLPTAIAMGWVWNMIRHGRFPGLAKDAFYPTLFRDQVHPNFNGAYLVDLTWFSAFYGESPVDRVPPILTDFSAEQARVLQEVAWDAIRNYPDCGLYEEGSQPAAPPRFTPKVAQIVGDTEVRLSSATPGAWFRYTLDGTTPTRTRGYVYCGAITARPGMTIKAIAYRSGMADGRVSEAVYGGKP